MTKQRFYFYKGGQWQTGSWEVNIKRKYTYISLRFIEGTQTKKVLNENFDLSILDKEYDIFETLEYYYFNK